MKHYDETDLHHIRRLRKKIRNTNQSDKKFSLLLRLLAYLKKQLQQ